jgi:hypothetical protein
MSVIAKLSLASVVSLLIVAPAVAQTPAHEGDYYAPSKTIVQQPGAAQIQQDKQGDYYAPGKTTVQQPSATQVQQDKQGDYYPPGK